MTYECSDCGKEYPSSPDRFRCACGGPFRFVTPALPEQRPTQVNREKGLWAFDALLPIDRRVTLGEGWTPLVDAPERDATYKCEWLFPTGSFKDRGAALTLSQAVEMGVSRVVEDSSGNAGAAIATYAARAGIDAEIFVPADAKAGKLRAIENAGATLRRVPGSRQDVTDACLETVESSEAWYASHAYQPAFFEGTATMAYEIAAQRDWQVPDAVVTPLGHGTMFLGLSLGFSRLRQAGWTETIPRLYGVQAAGVAPIVAARHGSKAATGTNDLADGIQIHQPVRESEIHEALDATGGDVIAVSRDHTNREYHDLGRQGFHVEPTCAVAPVGYDRFRERGEIESGEDVVIALTGSGLML